MYIRTGIGIGQSHSSDTYSSSQPPGSYLNEPWIEPRLGDPLADRLRSAWNASHNRGEIIRILRGHNQPAPRVTNTLREIFARDPEAFWLAEKLARYGPEPLWESNEITARVRRARGHRWMPERGNIMAILSDSTPDSELWALPLGVPQDIVACIERAEREAETHPVRAYFFPGRSEYRALIISGVHGSEPSGVEVVQRLRTLLATNSAAGRLPYFTTILVPYVIPRTQGTMRCPGPRYVPNGVGLVNGIVGCQNVEPNRNFPLPGVNYHRARFPELTRARARVQSIPVPVELLFRRTRRAPMGPCTSIRMLPETRILIRLIERFQPERLASIHTHSLKKECRPCNRRVTRCGGEGPGIFVDPRGLDIQNDGVTNQRQVDVDDELARRMLIEGQSQFGAMNLPMIRLDPRDSRSRLVTPFDGNEACDPSTVRYYSPQTVEGNSLGDWTPVPTDNRPGITTLTIEVPHYRRILNPGYGLAPSNCTPETTRVCVDATREVNTVESRVIDLHAKLLRDIFLEYRREDTT